MQSERRRRNPASGLLARQTHGVLSTLSIEHAGFPFGSLLPYCLDQQGYPVILISRLAQHTKNIRGDARVSLLIAESGVANVHKAARLTLVAEASELAGRADAERYYRYYPHCRGFEQELDFEFYRLIPQSCYYVGGFGRITPYSPDSVCENLCFDAETENSIVAQMNLDQVRAMQAYCDAIGHPSSQDETPCMVGVDPLGFHLRVDEHLLRFDFSQPLQTAQEVRAELMQMSAVG